MKFFLIFISITISIVSANEFKNLPELYMIDNVFYKKFTTTPFTGKAKHIDRINRTVAIGNFENGLVDGRINIFDLNGNLKTQMYFKKGKKLKTPISTTK